MLEIVLKKLEDNCEVIFGSEEASGMDIKTMNIKRIYRGSQEIAKENLDKVKKSFKNRGYIKLRPFERVLFGSGLELVEIKHNFQDTLIELQVRSRSGFSLTEGLISANSPGTIDQDYRGEIGIILYNSTPYLQTVKLGDRVAQLVPSYVPQSRVFYSQTNNYETTRGTKGFGSTGK